MSKIVHQPGLAPENTGGINRLMIQQQDQKQTDYQMRKKFLSKELPLKESVDDGIKTPTALNRDDDNTQDMTPRSRILYNIKKRIFETF